MISLTHGMIITKSNNTFPVPFVAISGDAEFSDVQYYVVWFLIRHQFDSYKCLLDYFTVNSESGNRDLSSTFLCFIVHDMVTLFIMFIYDYVKFTKTTSNYTL